MRLRPLKLQNMILKLFQKIKALIVRLFHAPRVFYINGSESLPPPLSEAEEGELVDRIGEIEARQRLTEHNLRLVVYIAKRFENTGVSIEELISIGTVGLMKAVNSFNKEKNIRLATYASRCIENEILMFLRKKTTRKKELSIDEPLSVDWDGNELLLSDVLGSDPDVVSREMEEDEERQALLAAVSTLDERERMIIVMRYGLGGTLELTQKEVADLLGISQSYISRLEKRIISNLRRQIEAKI